LRRALLAVALGAVALGGCRQDMHDQPRFEVYERLAPPPIPGTVARGQLHDDVFFETGKVGDQFADTFPLPVVYLETGQRPPEGGLFIDIRRGRERFEIYCAPCHGLSGRGNGMVVERGYRPPPSLHIDRLRNERPGYLFDVITRGFGAMPDYAAQIPVRDRWAIVAYVRALQLSQNAPLAELPNDLRKKVTGGSTP
jgi:mono/diheme cytochrome c family protein